MVVVVVVVMVMVMVMVMVVVVVVVVLVYYSMPSAHDNPLTHRWQFIIQTTIINSRTIDRFCVACVPITGSDRGVIS